MESKTKKKFIVPLLLTLTAAVMLIVCPGAVFADEPCLSVNENGQTYGPLSADVHSNSGMPELVAATGVDGVKGYVYYDDLERDTPQNPEEAKEYMERLDTLIREANERGDRYLWYIPLYASDGVTVIGSFGISNPKHITNYECIPD